MMRKIYNLIYFYFFLKKKYQKFEFIDSRQGSTNSRFFFVFFFCLLEKTPHINWDEQNFQGEINKEKTS